MYTIEQVPSYVVWPIRKEVMYPDFDLEKVKLKDDEKGMHLALFDQNELISVVSLFRNGTDMQFRKLATLNAYQGNGYGTNLLKYIIQYTESEGCTKLWCNARINAAPFYSRFGFIETAERFTKNGLDFVIMELSLRGSDKF